MRALPKPRVWVWLLVVLVTQMAHGAASDPERLTDLARRAEAELRQNILPFWLAHVPHPGRDGFYGEVHNPGQPRESAPRAALMTSRILWTFSAAFRRYGDPAYREMADRAYQDLTANFRDEAHGGYLWSVTADGAPLQTFKHLYGQAFALYSLSEYYRATGVTAARERAIELFRLIEEKTRDHPNGGYFESFTREWQRTPEGQPTVIGPGHAKSQNAHLHLMEAYAALLRAWPDEQVRAAQRELVEVMLTRILDPKTAHLGMYFDEDWTPRSDVISYGHDIEFAWLVTEAATELGDAELLARVRPVAVRIAEVTLAEGVEPDGAIPYDAGPEGIRNPQRDWWVPAEAAVGFLNAYQLSDDPKFARAAEQQWEFIERHFIDRKNGEWHASLDAQNAVVPRMSKANPWKCPYHNGRACLELVQRVRALTAQP